MVQDYIEKAENGDVESARELMQLFVDTKPGEIDKRLQAYFTDCFKLALSGVKPARALGLERPACRPRDPKQKGREVDAAILFHEAKRANPKKKDTEIYGEINKSDGSLDGNPIKGKSDRTLRKAKDDHETLANNVLDIIEFLNDENAEPGAFYADE